MKSAFIIRTQNSLSCRHVVYYSATQIDGIDIHYDPFTKLRLKTHSNWILPIIFRQHYSSTMLNIKKIVCAFFFLLPFATKAQNTSFNFFKADSTNLTIDDVRQLADSSFVICGYNTSALTAFHAHLNRFGSVISSTTLECKNYHISSITLDHGSVHASFDFAPAMLISKTDLSGNIEWQKSLSDPLIRYAGNFISQIEGNDTMIYIFGNKHNLYGNTNQAMLFIKMDYRGNLIKSTFCDPPMLNFYIPSCTDTCYNKGFISVYRMKSPFTSGQFTNCIVKIDSSLHIEWTTNLVMGGATSNLIQDIIQTEDSGFLYIGSINTVFPGPYYTVVGKLNSSGTLLWQKVFNQNYVFDEMLKHDSATILAFGKQFLSSTNAVNYIMQMDYSGNISSVKSISSYQNTHWITGASVSETGKYTSWGNVNISGNFTGFVTEIDSQMSGLCTDTTRTIADTISVIPHFSDYNLIDSAFIIQIANSNLQNVATVYQTNDVCSGSTATENISANSNLKQLRIFPNPSTGVFTIYSNEITKELKINIQTIDGKNVYSGKVKSGQEIGLNLRSGIYLLKILDGENTFSEKLVITN